MNPDRIIIVCGLGRCGTSMMMRMLHCGGVVPYCPVHKLGNSYETIAATRLPENWKWLENARGMAVKVLDPHRFRLPAHLPYDVILMRRNERQQAKSQVKFMIGTGHTVQSNRHSVRVLAKSNVMDMGRIVEMFEGYEDARVLRVSFEDVLNDPAKEAVRVALHLGMDDPGTRAAHMAFQVHERDAGCLPGMAEYRMPGIAQ